MSNKVGHFEANTRISLSFSDSQITAKYKFLNSSQKQKQKKEIMIKIFMHYPVPQEKFETFKKL